jgi:hypothetical protein
MNRPHIRPLALSALLTLAAPATAAPFSWFDDAPGALDTRLWSPRYAAFAVDLHAPADAPDVSGFAVPEAGDALRLTGGFGREPWPAGLALNFPEPEAERGNGPRLRAFGIAWQHRFDAASHVTVSADYRRAAPLFAAIPEMADRRASLSLTSRWAGDYHPRLTGSMFVGGEHATGEVYRALGRRYYGFAATGELTLFRSHTPYLSFQTQRAYAGSEVELPGTLPGEEYSLITAGWKWQAKPYLSLQAEASYGYNGNRLQLQDPEHSRVFFGTRFDFK